jgi:hypothetical protein
MAASSLSEVLFILLFVDLGAILPLGCIAFAKPPASLRPLIHKNCFRADGSFSINREMREAAHIFRIKCRLFVMLVVILFVANVPVLLFHLVVMPVPMAVQVLFSDARDVAEGHLRWFVDQGGDREDALLWESVLSSAWPVVLLAAVLFFYFAWRLYKSFYLTSWQEYETARRERQEEYYVNDSAHASETERDSEEYQGGYTSDSPTRSNPAHPTG